MASKRNTILDYIAGQLATVSGMHPERVVVGWPDLAKVQSDPVLCLQWHGDKGIRSDGRRERQFHLRVMLLSRIDRAQAAGQLRQLSEVYDVIHARLEAIADGDCNRLALVMKEEDDGGIEPSGFDDGDAFATVESPWFIKYVRASQATT